MEQPDITSEVSAQWLVWISHAVSVEELKNIKTIYKHQVIE